MTLSRAAALIFSLLLHSAILVGIHIPQAPEELINQPTVVTFQMTHTPPVQKPEPIQPEILDPIQPPVQDIPVEKQPEPVEEETIPTASPTATHSPWPTPTRPAPTQIPTHLPQATPTLLPVQDLAEPETAQPIEQDVLTQVSKTETTKPVKKVLREKPEPETRRLSKPNETQAGDIQNNQAAKDYRQNMINQLQSSRRYPRLARRRKQEGAVVVKFSIREDGTLQDISIAKSSGYEILDEATLRLVQRVFPMPPPPKNVGDFQVTIRYSLDD